MSHSHQRHRVFGIWLLALPEVDEADGAAQRSPTAELSPAWASPPTPLPSATHPRQAPALGCNAGQWPSPSTYLPPVVVSKAATGKFDPPTSCSESAGM